MNMSISLARPFGPENPADIPTESDSSEPNASDFTSFFSVPLPYSAVSQPLSQAEPSISPSVELDPGPESCSVPSPPEQKFRQTLPIKPEFPVFTTKVDSSVYPTRIPQFDLSGVETKTKFRPDDVEPIIEPSSLVEEQGASVMKDPTSMIANDSDRLDFKILGPGRGASNSDNDTPIKPERVTGGTETKLRSGTGFDLIVEPKTIFNQVPEPNSSVEQGRPTDGSSTTDSAVTTTEWELAPSQTNLASPSRPGREQAPLITQILRSETAAAETKRSLATSLQFNASSEPSAVTPIAQFDVSGVHRVSDVTASTLSEIKSLTLEVTPDKPTGSQEGFASESDPTPSPTRVNASFKFPASSPSSESPLFSEYTDQASPSDSQPGSLLEAPSVPPLTNSGTIGAFKNPESASPLRDASLVAQVEPNILILATAAKSERERNSLKMQLHPAELGMVEITLVRHGSGSVSAHIMAENEAARSSLNENMLQLRESLESAGLQVEKLEVGFRSSSSHGQGGNDRPAQQERAYFQPGVINDQIGMSENTGGSEDRLVSLRA